MIKRALVAVDGSEHANRAVDLACGIASRFEADLIVVHVVPDKPLSEAERKMAEVEFRTRSRATSILRAWRVPAATLAF